MSLRNEFLPLLLLGLVLLALIAVGVQGLPVPLPMLRLLLGLLYVLYVPGYTLQAALFPRADDLDGPERLALSFGLSVAVVPPMALLLDALPWGIRLWPIVVCEALFMLACAALALFRRQRLPPEERFVLTVEFDPRAWWAELDRTQRRLFALLGLALCLFAIGAIAIIVTPKPGERLTEFYILGPEGLAENYPREATVGQPITVTMGIANREGVSAQYRVEAWSEGDLLQRAGPFDLPNGETKEWPFALVLHKTGKDVKIEFLLYRDSGHEPYRSLRLWIEVKEEKGTS
ncbi:MAG: DUF1616 domain-containing protein [Chloroflexi bacterium]|nr:DUF1616 domain-containing protein [Chloroflexota bacterium]